MRRVVWLGIVLGVVVLASWPGRAGMHYVGAQVLYTPTNTPAPPPPTLVTNPSQGPPGTVVDFSGVGFPSVDAGSTANLYWDGQTLGSTTLVTCAGSTVISIYLYIPPAGFGTACGGPSVFFTVPAAASVGNHTVLVYDPNAEVPVSVSLQFYVSGPNSGPTNTPTVTPTATDTPIPGFIISTLTATPRPKVTASKTPTPRPAPTATHPAGVVGPPGDASKLIDGHLDQGWVSPHVNGAFATVAFETQTLYRLTGAVIDAGTTPGQNSADLRRFQLYASTTDRSASSFHLVFAGACEQNNLLQRFVFPEPVLARYIQLVVVDNYGNPKSVIIAEFEAVGHPATSSFRAEARVMRWKQSASKKPSPLGQVRKIVRGLGVAAPKDKLRTGHVRQSLYSRYALRTLKKQQAGIQFRDGTMLYLDQNTDAVLNSPTQTTVKRGVTEQKIEPGTDHSITTGSATADAIGTDFVTYVQGKLTSIYVVEGAVLVHNQFGSVVVKTGQFTTVQKGSAPQQPASYNGTQNPNPSGWSQKLPDPHLPQNFALDANGGRVVGTSG
jgi:hypothetical protein